MPPIIQKQTEPSHKCQRVTKIEHLFPCIIKPYNHQLGDLVFWIHFSHNFPKKKKRFIQ